MRMRVCGLLAGLLFELALVAPAAAAGGAAAPYTPAGGTAAQYRQWITAARALYPYPEPPARMIRVMLCESGGNRLAVGSGRWYGLFQYVPSTWHGRWNPYRASSIYDAKAQIFATAKAWSIGMQHQWSCYALTR